MPSYLNSVIRAQNFAAFMELIRKLHARSPMMSLTRFGALNRAERFVATRRRTEDAEVCTAQRLTARYGVKMVGETPAAPLRVATHGKL